MIKLKVVHNWVSEFITFNNLSLYKTLILLIMVNGLNYYELN